MKNMLVCIMGWVVFPPNLYVEVPQNEIIFGDRVFKEVIKFRCSHVGGPYSTMCGVLIRNSIWTCKGTHMHRAEAMWGHRCGQGGHLKAKERDFRRHQTCHRLWGRVFVLCVGADKEAEAERGSHLPRVLQLIIGKLDFEPTSMCLQSLSLNLHAAPCFKQGK